MVAAGGSLRRSVHAADRYQMRPVNATVTLLGSLDKPALAITVSKSDPFSIWPRAGTSARRRPTYYLAGVSPRATEKPPRHTARGLLVGASKIGAGEAVVLSSLSQASKIGAGEAVVLSLADETNIPRISALGNPLIRKKPRSRMASGLSAFRGHAAAAAAAFAAACLAF
jgi:hypothetical protein